MNSQPAAPTTPTTPTSPAPSSDESPLLELLKVDILNLSKEELEKHAAQLSALRVPSALTAALRSSKPSSESKKSSSAQIDLNNLIYGDEES